MTDSHFELPYLGTVNVEDRLIEYDGARLFTVRTENGGRFIGFWAIEKPEESVFWYASIGDERYNSLLHGDLDLRDVFEKPESRFVLETKFYGDENWPSVFEYRAPARLESAAFPEVGYRLNVYSSLKERANFRALQLKRFVAVILFDYKRKVSEASIRPLSQVMAALQDTMDSIGQALEGHPTARGPIKDEITDKTSLALRGLVLGSFGIELAAENLSDLFGVSLASRSFDAFTNLLDAGGDREKLGALLRDYGPRTVRQYRKVIQGFAEADADIDINSGAPVANSGRNRRLKQEQIPEIIEALYAVDPAHRETRRFDAELIGYNKRTRTFEVRDTLEDKRYSGKVTGGAVEPAQSAQIGVIYQIKIAITSEYEPLVGSEVRKYELFEMRDSLLQPKAEQTELSDR